MTRDELVSSLSKGNKLFRKENLKGVDLSSLDLSGCDLRKCDLSGANLSSSNLTDAILASAKLAGANFSGATVDGIYLENASGLDTANFVGAIYGGVAIKKQSPAFTQGGYQGFSTDRFMQIGCLQGDESYWTTMTEGKLRAMPIEAADKEKAVTFKNTYLADKIKDHQDLKKEPKP